jgi:DNA-directed RNA polymerase specialized sigma24 family protein
MSAALQLPVFWEAGDAQRNDEGGRERRQGARTAVRAEVRAEARAEGKPAAVPQVSLAFYRKHAEKTLRRYLYASMQVGRAPSILGEPIARGWVSSRPVHTFEDAVIFVLDVERCLNSLGSLDRQMLYRVVIQEYTQAEAGTLLGMSVRSISNKFPVALDHLTEKLLAAGLLVLPD